MQKKTRAAGVLFAAAALTGIVVPAATAAPVLHDGGCEREYHGWECRSVEHRELDPYYDGVAGGETRREDSGEHWHHGQVEGWHDESGHWWREVPGDGYLGDGPRDDGPRDDGPRDDRGDSRGDDRYDGGSR